jgi:hypothetical protein
VNTIQDEMQFDPSMVGCWRDRGVSIADAEWDTKNLWVLLCNNLLVTKRHEHIYINNEYLLNV